MRTPAILTLISLCGLCAALIFSELSEWLLLAVPCLVASLILLLLSWRKRAATSDNWVIVDGSNVMHWRDGKPDIETLREVLTALTAADLQPAVVFDANAGYKIAGLYLGDRTFGELIGLPVNRVMVAPKGTPADPLILTAARDYNARIVTNDRFRDWSEEYGDVIESGLVRGGFRKGNLWLSL